MPKSVRSLFSSLELNFAWPDEGVVNITGFIEMCKMVNRVIEICLQ